MKKEERSVIVCPMDEEMEELKAVLESRSIALKEYQDGTIKGYEFEEEGKGKFLAFVARIGKTNIGFDLGYLAALFDLKRIIVVGVSGSLKEDIVPLQVVIADKVAYYDCDLTMDGTGKYKLGQMAGEDLYYEADKEMLKKIDDLNTTLTIHVGTIISGDSFATKKNMSSELLKNFDDPLSVDMESASVAQVAHRLNIPFFVIRGISDQVLGEQNGAEFAEFLHPSARRAATVFVHLLKDEFLD